MNVDLSGLRSSPPGPPAEPIQPGDIMRSRRGDLYLVAVVPPDELTQGRSSTYLYYFRLNRDGEVVRVGQIMIGAAERDWTLIGRVEFSIGAPEWYIS